MSPSVNMAWFQSSKGKRRRPSPAAIAKALKDRPVVGLQGRSEEYDRGATEK
jgi:hypothetical protein